MNPTISVVTCHNQLETCNVESAVGRPDITVDCLDNFDARHLINDYSTSTGIPLVHGAIRGRSGHITFLHPPETFILDASSLRHYTKPSFPYQG